VVRLCAIRAPGIANRAGRAAASFRHHEDVHAVKPIILTTRKSPLALAQAHLVAARLASSCALDCTLLPLVSTGDRQAEWSLETRGGKGLFTAELEEALLRGDADLAVHSAKDLPGNMPPGLTVAGYLPRADVRDVLVRRTAATDLSLVATSSPRRRAQLARLFPEAKFSEIRGNVDTRLNKIAQGVADATVLAAAGLSRLKIDGWPGLEFQSLAISEMVPAIGQGAIAVQCRIADVGLFRAVLDPETERAVGFERALQAALGAGCHTASAAHVHGSDLAFFDERAGMRSLTLTADQLAQPLEAARDVLRSFGLI
jgi:hydroxymethylbilane synthase